MGQLKEINGTDVYFEYKPHPYSKYTLVLIHGFLSSTFSFRHLSPLLKEKYSIVSLDIPPFGKSGKSKTFIYSYKNMAKTVITLLEQLNIEEAIVIGHSMGGQIALNMAVIKPSLIKKVILLNSSSYLKRSKWPIIFSSYFPFFHVYVKLRLTRSGVRNNLQNVVHDTAIINDEMMFGYLQPFLENEIFGALTKMIRHREGDLPTKVLQTIEVPCLLIWGEHDRIVPVHIGTRLQKDLPQSEMVVIKDAGHLVTEEKPTEVQAYIDKFLEQS